RPCLIKLIRTGHLDVIVTHKHLAIPGGLDYIVLSQEINLGDHRYSDSYECAEHIFQSKDRTTYE
ncbi:MAG TPA: hypothetical protein VFM31_07875, partial [Nitrososphaeraceae archaeon]|nr:hypothetical protein [Nitrososphaeraceae archaeon]